MNKPVSDRLSVRVVASYAAHECAVKKAPISLAVASARFARLTERDACSWALSSARAV
jgi:hypothetical protein